MSAALKPREVDSYVRDLIRAGQFDGPHFRVTARLSRPQYERMNEVLTMAGGKWNRSAKAHVFTGDARAALASVLDEGTIADKKREWQQFYTPPVLAAELVLRAGVRSGMIVLEPSAGRGAIAREARAMGAAVACYEIDPENVAALMAEDFPVGECDFLTVKPHPRPPFDAIVMNPPFANSADVRHVTHALKFLKPKGTLVAVMGAGVSFRDSREHSEFRALVEARGGTMEPLDDGSFREADTLVRTVMVCIPGGAQ